MEMREKIRLVLPSRMKARPIDHRGYPVPWFVTVKDAAGHWDFRPIEPYRLLQAMEQKVCWICGHRLGRQIAFAVGPMCGVNRISGEPPQHLECAEFAVKTCPFMLLPAAKRRTANLPGGVTGNPGALKRNPGVTLVWSTTKYSVVNNDPGYLFKMGRPTSLSFWKEGRRATRAEINASIAGGLPTLSDMAEAEGPRAAAALRGMVSKFKRLLPA